MNNQKEKGKKDEALAEENKPVPRTQPEENKPVPRTQPEENKPVPRTQPEEYEPVPKITIQQGVEPGDLKKLIQEKKQQSMNKEKTEKSSED